jgi:hypothetical protein
MQDPAFTRYGLGMCAMAALLAGCGGSQPPGAMPQTSAVATHPERGTSWMLQTSRAGSHSR